MPKTVRDPLPVILGIAGLTLAFHVNDARLRNSILRRYHPFLTHADPFLHLSTRLISGARPSQSTVPELIEKPGEISAYRPDFSLRFNPRTHQGELRIVRSIYSFDTVLRLLLSWYLPRYRQGFLLHAASVIIRGKAYLFPGVSGTGKSTLARLCRKSPVLSDELVALTQSNGVFRVHGTPFFGKLKGCGVNQSALLGRILYPVKAPVCELKAISRNKAMTLVLRCVMNFSRHPVSINRIFRHANDLTGKKTPVHFMDFSRARGFSRWISRA